MLASLVVCLGGVPALARKTLNVGAGGAFTSLDPHYHNLGPNNVVASYIFGGLTRFDPKFQPEPDLAVSWRTVDPTTWEFKPREGLYRQAVREAMADEPVIPLHHQVNVSAMRAGLAMRERMQEGIRAWEITPR